MYFGKNLCRINIGKFDRKINSVPFVEIRRATLQGLPCPGSQHPARPVGLTGRAINCRNLTSTEKIIFDCPDRDSRDEIITNNESNRNEDLQRRYKDVDTDDLLADLATIWECTIEM